MVEYPILSQRKIDQFLKKLTKPEYITIGSARFNKKELALYVMLNHRDRGPLDNDGIDELLSIVNFNCEPSDEVLCRLEGRYNESKCYTFERKGQLWVVIGDNCYGDDWTRIHLEWDAKIDKKSTER